MGNGLIPTRTFKYLGLFMDQNLLWSKHILQVENKLSRAI